MKKEFNPAKSEKNNIDQDIFRLCDHYSKKLDQEWLQNMPTSSSKKLNVEALILGQKGQNTEYFIELLLNTVRSCSQARKLEQQIKSHITPELRNSQSFRQTQEELSQQLNKILINLKKLSPPFYSSRYYAHMNWENTLPSILGYFAGILFNPNNASLEGNPLTTLLQINVMKRFAEMFDLPPLFALKSEDGEKYSWGHLTCGGTVANLQSLWAARNCRFLPLSIRKYVEKHIKKNKGNSLENVLVQLPDSTRKKLINLSAWEILNIDNDQAMNLYDRAFNHYFQASGQSEERRKQVFEQFRQGVQSFSIGKVGLYKIQNYLRILGKDNQKWQLNEEVEVPSSIVLISGAKHYSIPKSFSVLGLGDQFVHKIDPDIDGRIQISSLKQKIEECLKNNIPILSLIVISGTTEIGAIDNIEEILTLREHFRKKNLYFHLHIDGAYGGYFCSLLRKKGTFWNSISNYTERQLSLYNQADSITFDPHKTGYVPYSCGGIIYRNYRVRQNLSFRGKYIESMNGPNMSFYGIEGSKPGAVVISLYLSLQMMPLIRSGHGQLLDRTIMNSKIFSASLYRIEKEKNEYEYEEVGEKKSINERFYCYQLARKSIEKTGQGSLEMESEAYRVISETHPLNMEKQMKKVRNETGETYEHYYLNLGSDTNILCYGLNFEKKQNGHIPNRSLRQYNKFNSILLKICSVVCLNVEGAKNGLYLGKICLQKALHKQAFLNFLERYHLEEDDDHIVFARSTIMNASFTHANQLKNSSNPNALFLQEIKKCACQALIAYRDLP